MFRRGFKRGEVALFSLATLLFPVFPSASAADSADWPQWRGPRSEGVWRGVKLPAKLSPDLVETRWKAALGGGYAGIAVAEGRVLTMDLQKEPRAAERVLCFGREDGKLLWKHEYPVEYGDLDHPSGPRATPTVRDGRVYTLGTMGHLFCLELASGKVIFSHELGNLPGSRLPTWGHAASPLMIEELMVVQAGAGPPGTVMAFDRKTGAERWRSLGDRAGYSTPIVRRRGGRDELVVWTPDNVHGLNPLSGGSLWKHPFKTSQYDVAIISPVAEGGQVLVSGYWDGSEAIRIDASPPDGAALRSVWKSRELSCLMATPLFRDGYLYALDKKDGLLCLEWETGKVLWSDGHRMTPKDRNPQASMVWCDGARAAVLNAEGQLILARLGPEGYQEEGRAPIIGPTWAHPAFAGQEVFARSDTELVCVRIRGGE